MHLIHVWKLHVHTYKVQRCYYDRTSINCKVSKENVILEDEFPTLIE
jgi:hypothetical protein